MPDYLTYYRRTRHPGYIPGVQPSPAFPTVNLTLWLKADVGVYKDAGVTLAANGETVEQWNDQSGNGYNAVQSTAGSRPTYSTSYLNTLPGVTSNGSKSMVVSGFSAHLGTTSTVYVVFQLNGTQLAYSVIKLTGAADEFWRWDGNGSSYISTLRGTRLSAAYAAPSSGAKLQTICSGTGYDVWIGSTNMVSTTTSWGVGTDLTLFTSNSSLNGGICELLIYNTAHSSADRASVWANLQAKWGV